MIPVPFKIDRIGMVYYPESVVYNVHTDKGMVAIQQAPDSTFYEPTWLIDSKNFKEVIGLSLAWDKDYKEHIEQQDAQELEELEFNEIAW